LEDSVRALADYNPSIVGISVSDLGIVRSGILQKFVAHLKYSFCPKIILGGYIPTFLGDELLERIEGIDLLIKGEAEHSLPLALCGNPASSSRVLNLDELPFPKREIFSLDRNREIFHLEEYGLKEIPIIESWGCTFNRCNYCGIRRGFRRRSIGNVIREIEELNQLSKNQERNFCFYSDLFLMDDTSEELLDELIKREIRGPFYVATRADQMLSARKSLLRKMAIADFRIYPGFESFSDTQLARWNKGISAEDNELALKRAIENKIMHTFNIIYADPDTTKQEYQQTAKKAIEYVFYHKFYKFRLLTLCPGSRDWKKFRDSHKEADPFSLDILYESHYPDWILDLRQKHSQSSRYLLSLYNQLHRDPSEKNIRESKDCLKELLLG